MGTIRASDILRQHNVSGMVLPDKHVYHTTRSEAPKAVQDALEQSAVKNEAKGIQEDYVCLVEPWMPGRTVTEYIQENPYLNPKAVMKCLADVATTLAEMHKLNVSHNDIQSDNIMVIKQDKELE